jgi:hypothetical protein
MQIEKAYKHILCDDTLPFFAQSRPIWNVGIENRGMEGSSLELVFGMLE